MTPTQKFHNRCKIDQWKAIPSLVTLLLFVSELLAKNHTGAQNDPPPLPTRAKAWSKYTWSGNVGVLCSRLACIANRSSVHTAADQRPNSGRCPGRLNTRQPAHLADCRVGSRRLHKTCYAKTTSSKLRYATVILDFVLTLIHSPLIYKSPYCVGTAGRRSRMLRRKPTGPPSIASAARCASSSRDPLALS